MSTNTSEDKQKFVSLQQEIEILLQPMKDALSRDCNDVFFGLKQAKGALENAEKILQQAKKINNHARCIVSDEKGKTRELEEQLEREREQFVKVCKESDDEIKKLRNRSQHLERENDILREEYSLLLKRKKKQNTGEESRLREVYNNLFAQHQRLLEENASIEEFLRQKKEENRNILAREEDWISHCDQLQKNLIELQQANTLTIQDAVVLTGRAESTIRSWIKKDIVPAERESEEGKAPLVFCVNDLVQVMKTHGIFEQGRLPLRNDKETIAELEETLERWKLSCREQEVRVKELEEQLNDVALLQHQFHSSSNKEGSQDELVARLKRVYNWSRKIYHLLSILYLLEQDGLGDEINNKIISLLNDYPSLVGEFSVLPE